MKNLTFWTRELKYRNIRCQQCGEERAKKVYHHDHNVNNDAERNLILLCNSCYNYLTRIKKKSQSTGKQEDELRRRKALEIIEWIKKKRYYEKHKTLRLRIDKLTELLK